ncbi:hypothetical protein [Bacteroides sp.]
MKLFFNLVSIAMISFCLASCSAFRSSTATALPVETSMKSYNYAELTVSPTKIKYDYRVRKTVRKHLKKSEIRATAISEALNNSGADLIVAPEFTEIRKGLFKKLKVITVVGYPATYTKFQTISCEKNKK